MGEDDDRLGAAARGLAARLRTFRRGLVAVLGDLRRAAPAALRFAWRALFWLAAATALWVMLYGVVDPPGGPYLAYEKRRLGAVAHRWRPLEETPPLLRRAVIAAEDARFCDHFGLDLIELRKAIEAWRAGGRLRGASTITQQTAKNVFLWTSRSTFRKALELWFAALIELFWGKPRTLEIYLNLAEFDEGVFGVEAAAQKHFGKPARELSLEEAARLAATLPAPKRRDPKSRSPGFRRRVRGIMSGARTLEAEGRAACVGA